MAKKRKPPQWDKKPCGCINTELPGVGKAVIRCERHRDKPSKKRVVCYFDESGLVRQA